MKESKAIMQLLRLPFLAVTLGAVFLGTAFAWWPIWSLMTMVTLPFLFQAFKNGMRNLENWPEFLPAVKATILMNFLFLSILSISFVV